MRCSTCGSIYSVTYTKVRFRDQDYENCGICGHELHRWSSSRIPHFTLEKAEPWARSTSGTAQPSN